MKIGNQHAQTVMSDRYIVLTDFMGSTNTVSGSVLGSRIYRELLEEVVVHEKERSRAFILQSTTTDDPLNFFKQQIRSGIDWTHGFHRSRMPKRHSVSYV